MMLAIKINAGNDRNGNPRRGWIIADQSGDFVSFVDEGFQGSGALRASAYANAVPTSGSIDVLPAVYKSAYTQSYGAIEKAAKRENKLYRKLR